MHSKALRFMLAIPLVALVSAAAPPTHTLAQLKEGEALVKKALPYAETQQTLTTKLGKPKHDKNWDTDSWFALDGDKCMKLWISATRDGKTTGALASGKPDDCK